MPTKHKKAAPPTVREWLYQKRQEAQRNMERVMELPLADRLNVWGRQFFVSFVALFAGFTIALVSITIGPAPVPLVDVLQAAILASIIYALLGTWYIPFSARFRWALGGALLLPVLLLLLTQAWAPWKYPTQSPATLRQLIGPCVAISLPTLAVYAGYKYRSVVTRWLFRCFVLCAASLVAFFTWTNNLHL